VLALRDGLGKGAARGSLGVRSRVLWREVSMVPSPKRSGMLSLTSVIGDSAFLQEHECCHRVTSHTGDL
jgi:hypothetical protein